MSFISPVLEKNLMSAPRKGMQTFRTFFPRPLYRADNDLGDQTS